jgi:hypothetical protein
LSFRSVDLSILIHRRELAELQGGEIGIATELDVGSTFAFFVKTQTAAAVKEQRLQDELSIRPRSGSVHTSFSHEVSAIHVLVVEGKLDSNLCYNITR